MKKLVVGLAVTYLACMMVQAGSFTLIDLDLRTPEQRAIDVGASPAMETRTALPWYGWLVQIIEVFKGRLIVGDFSWGCPKEVPVDESQENGLDPSPGDDYEVKRQKVKDLIRRAENLERKLKQYGYDEGYGSSTSPVSGS